jgi:hypothetical protein
MKQIIVPWDSVKHRFYCTNCIRLISDIHERTNVSLFPSSGPKAGMALVGHADANRYALLNTTKLPVYSICRLCQQAQTLSLLVVVQGQCTMGCAADESGMEGGFPAP